MLICKNEDFAKKAKEFGSGIDREKKTKGTWENDIFEQAINIT